MVRHSGSHCHHYTLFRKIMSDTASASSNKMPFSLIIEQWNKVKTLLMKTSSSHSNSGWTQLPFLLCTSRPAQKIASVVFLTMIFIKALGSTSFTGGKRCQHPQANHLWIVFLRKDLQSTKRKHVYKLPYDAAGLGELATHKFAGRTLCLSALRQLFDLGQKKWEGIKKIVMSSGVSPVHKAKGKPGNRRFKEDNPVIFALQNHFS